MQLEPEERRRLNSWAGAIAQTLRPEAVVALTPEGLRLGRRGSLSIAATGEWYSHEAARGGECAGSLVRHLRKCSAAEAVGWAREWLDAHPGDGTLSAEGAAEAAAQAGELRAAYARQCLDEAIEAAGTPVESYLRRRGLEPPYPDLVRHLPDGRVGESALISVLTTETGEPVGCQLTYLDPDGRKTTILPERQVFLLDKTKAQQSAFRVHVDDPAEDAAPMVVCEGLEDALSIARSGAAITALGLPGVGRFGDFDLPDTDVVVFRDGDAADSEATKQLAAAVDRWLLAGAQVRVTDTPAGEDANSILQATGPAELRRLVGEAKPAELSYNADVVRLAGLDLVHYERERAGAAKRHDVRVGFLDAAVKAARSEAEAAAAEAAEDETPHPEPVPNLAEVLDAALTEMKRYVAASEHDLAAAVLWAVHTPFVHHGKVWLSVTPKLAIQSPDRGCGKSTLLEVLGALVPRPETGSSITASVVFRLIEARKPTLLVDEADRILRSSNDELIAVLNSSHRRAGAYVWRTEEIGGQRIPWKFSTWSPCAFAGIRELPSTLQDRSIIIRLNRAKPGEVTGHLRNGTSPALTLLKRKIIRWAADTVRLPEPQLPAGLHNRQGDNWSPLFSIAKAAGGRWPQLVKAAAVAGLGADQQDGTLVALLDGIRRAFGERDRLRTREMLDFLLADDEFDWGTANRGKTINEAFLREKLRNVISPAADGMPGSERWGSGSSKERGYTRARFVDAWQRYLPSFFPQNHPAHPAHPAQPLKTNDNSGPDDDALTRPKHAHPAPGNGAGPDAGQWAACAKRTRPGKKPIKSRRGPDGPDGRVIPGEMERVCLPMTGSGRMRRNTPGPAMARPSARRSCSDAAAHRRARPRLGT